MGLFAFLQSRAGSLSVHARCFFLFIVTYLSCFVNAMHEMTRRPRLFSSTVTIEGKKRRGEGAVGGANKQANAKNTRGALIL